jgi:hypothetical protein
VTGKCVVVAGSEGNQSGRHLSKAFARNDIVPLNGQIIACRYPAAGVSFKCHLPLIEFSKGMLYFPSEALKEPTGFIGVGVLLRVPDGD